MFLRSRKVSNCVVPSARYPLTLIFPIATLNLLVNAFLHLTLENPRPRGLVIVGYLQDVRRIDPVVGTASHDMMHADSVLIDRHLCNHQRNTFPCQV